MREDGFSSTAVMTDLMLAEVLDDVRLRSKIGDPIVTHVMREVDFSSMVVMMDLASATSCTRSPSPAHRR
jgi:hypothetical protein